MKLTIYLSAHEKFGVILRVKFSVMLKSQTSIIVLQRRESRNVQYFSTKLSHRGKII